MWKEVEPGEGVDLSGLSPGQKLYRRLKLEEARIDMEKQAQAKSCKTCSKEYVCVHNPSSSQSSHPFFPLHKNIGEFVNRLCNSYGECCREFELKQSYRAAIQFDRYAPVCSTGLDKDRGEPLLGGLISPDKQFKFKLGDLVQHYLYPGITFKVDKREHQEFTPSESASSAGMGGNQWNKYICKFERPMLGSQYEQTFSEHVLVRVHKRIDGLKKEDPLSSIAGVTFKMDKKKNNVIVPYHTWVAIMTELRGE